VERVDVRVLTVITTVLLSLFLLACSATEVTESSQSQQLSFCDSLATMFPENRVSLSPEWETFVAQTKGEESWSRLSPLYRWESDLIGLDWYAKQGDSSTGVQWLDTLGSRMPLSRHGLSYSFRILDSMRFAKGESITTSLEELGFRVPNANSETLKNISSYFASVKKWEHAYSSLKESLASSSGAYDPNPYTGTKIDENSWLSPSKKKLFLKLAYYAYNAKKEKLAQKNYAIFKYLDGDEKPECDEIELSKEIISTTSGTVVRKSPTVTESGVLPENFKGALDSIRALYIEQRLHQRVMWLAEQGLVKPLSAEEKKDWEALEKRYCSPVTPPCWIMGSETDGPVGYGRALEEEWEAGD